MHPDTLVALPPITAAQRQRLISVLHRAHADPTWEAHRSRIAELAHALDLHKDAVPAENPAVDPKHEAVARLLGVSNYAVAQADRIRHSARPFTDGTQARIAEALAAYEKENPHA